MRDSSIMGEKASKVGSMNTSCALPCAPSNLYNLVLVPKSTLYLY